MGRSAQDKIVGVIDRYFAVSQVEVSLLRGDHPGQHLGQLRLSVAVHAGDSDDLTAADGQGDIIEPVVL